MADSKLSQQLRERLDRAPQDSFVDVILEILPPEPSGISKSGSRQERIAAGRQQFLDAVAPVERRVEGLGGQVLDQAWLNHTLRVRVPARSVAELTESEWVASADTPKPLTRE